MRKLKLTIMVQLTQQERNVLTCAEIMELFQVCRTTIYNWEKQGKIQPYKVGRKKYYIREDIQNLFVKMF